MCVWAFEIIIFNTTGQVLVESETMLARKMMKRFQLFSKRHLKNQTRNNTRNRMVTTKNNKLNRRNLIVLRD